MTKPAQQEQKRLGYRTYWQKQNAKAPVELPKLATKANTAYDKSLTLWQRSLQYAKECGDALCEAKTYFRVKGKGPLKWKQWLSRNFYGPGKSYETVKVYMRISKKWDDPRLKAARRAGLSPKSIAGFLRLVTNKPSAEDRDSLKIGSRKQSAPLTEKDVLSALQYELRVNLFGRDLKRLNRQQLETMIAEWDMFLWPKWSRDIRSVAVQVLRYNPYLLGSSDGPSYDIDEEEEDSRMRETVSRKKRPKSWDEAARKGRKAHNT